MTTINEQDLKRLMTVSDFANSISVSPQRVYQMIKERKLVEVKIDNVTFIEV